MNITKAIMDAYDIYSDDIAAEEVESEITRLVADEEGKSELTVSQYWLNLQNCFENDKCHSNRLGMLAYRILLDNLDEYYDFD